MVNPLHSPWRRGDSGTTARQPPSCWRDLFAWLFLAVLSCLATPVWAADFGDAPDIHQIDPRSPCGFPTLSVSGGVRHIDTSRAWLGRTVTDEGDALVTDRDQDDGLSGRSKVKVHNQSWDGPLYLNVLFDTSSEGEVDCKKPYGLWQAASEWVVQNRVLRVAMGKDIDVHIPAVPNNTWVRITLSGSPANGYIGQGAFQIGETEDYYFVAAGKPAKTRTPPSPPHEPPFTPEGPQEGPGPTGGTDTGGGTGDGSGDGGGNAGGAGQPHAFIKETGFCKEDVARICRVPRPKYSTRCENCKYRHMNACLMDQCMEPTGRQYIQACNARRHALEQANNLFACINDPERGCRMLKGGAGGHGAGKPAHSDLVSQWKQQADIKKHNEEVMSRLKKKLRLERNTAFNQCRTQADEQCRGQCASDDDRYGTPQDDFDLRQCRGQKARCQKETLWRKQWGEPPNLSSTLASWNKGVRNAAGNAERLHILITDRLRQQLHPSWITFDKQPVKTIRKVLSSHLEHRLGKPRVFNELCRTVEVTPDFLTEWTKAEFWSEYDFTARVPLPLDLGTAALRGMLEIFKKIPAVGEAINKLEGFWDDFEKAELEGGDTGRAMLGTLKDTLRSELDNYIDGKVKNAKAKGMAKFEQLKGQVTEKLNDTLLTAKQRRSLKHMQGMIGKAQNLYQQTINAIDKAKAAGQLPERIKQEIKAKRNEVRQEAGLCSEKLQPQIVSKVKQDVESRLGKLLGKTGSITLSGGRIEGDAFTEGCVYKVRVKARLRTRICEEPTSCDIDWHKRVLTDACGEPPGEGGTEVLLIRPPDNISGFNPLDENDIRIEIGGAQRIEGQPVIHAGGGASAGGGTSGLPPCSAGPVGYGSGFNIVNFSYIETSGSCEVQPDLNQSAPFLAHGAPIFYIRRGDSTCTTPICLFMGNSFWSLISATPATSVSPGQFGFADGMPSNTPVTVVVQCTGLGCPAGNPAFTGTIIANPTQAQVQNFRPQ